MSMQQQKRGRRWDPIETVEAWESCEEIYQIIFNVLSYPQRSIILYSLGGKAEQEVQELLQISANEYEELLKQSREIIQWYYQTEKPYIHKTQVKKRGNVYKLTSWLDMKSMGKTQKPTYMSATIPLGSDGLIQFSEMLNLLQEKEL